MNIFGQVAEREADDKEILQQLKDADKQKFMVSVLY